MPLINMFLEHLASDGPWDETSARLGDMAIVAEYALPIMYILFENITFILEMVLSAEVAAQVMRGQRLQLGNLATLVSKLSDGLLHDVNECREPF